MFCRFTICCRPVIRQPGDAENRVNFFSFQCFARFVRVALYRGHMVAMP